MKLKLKQLKLKLVYLHYIALTEIKIYINLIKSSFLFFIVIYRFLYYSTLFESDAPAVLHFVRRFSLLPKVCFELLWNLLLLLSLVQN